MAELEFYDGTHSGQQIDSAIGKVVNADNTPTLNSANMVTSGGVFSALNQTECVLLGTSTTLEGSISISNEDFPAYKFFIAKVNAIGNGTETWRGNQVVVSKAELELFGTTNVNLVAGSQMNESTNVYAMFQKTGLTYWYANYVGTSVESPITFVCRLYGVKSLF